jgi:hypothetical protein
MGVLADVGVAARADAGDAEQSPALPLDQKFLPFGAS